MPTLLLLVSCLLHGAGCLHLTSPRHAHNLSNTTHIEADALHPWVVQTSVAANALPIELLALDDEEPINVYFVRHGQSMANKFVEEHRGVPLPSGPHEGYWDAYLTTMGVRQALAAQGTLATKLGLVNATPEKVQLAASLNSRCLDTLVVATGPLWQKWKTNGDLFRLQEVPAAMEYDNSVYSNRRFGIADDDPVRWEDSVLATNVSVLEHFNTAAARSTFYQTGTDKIINSDETTKPVEVLAAYERHRWPPCNRQQTTALMSYFKDVARLGKRHIVLGTSGLLTMCMAGAFAPNAEARTENGAPFVPSRQALPNVGVLHFHLKISDDGATAKLEPQVMYPNKFVSY